jgi:hypothetical protein
MAIGHRLDGRHRTAIVKSTRPITSRVAPHRHHETGFARVQQRFARSRPWRFPTVSHQNATCAEDIDYRR